MARSRRSRDKPDVDKLFSARFARVEVLRNRLFRAVDIEARADSEQRGRSAGHCEPAARAGVSRKPIWLP